MEVHPVTAGEVEAATGTIAQAFLGEPVWRVALKVEDRSEADLRAFWRFYVEGARRFDTAYAGADARTACGIPTYLESTNPRNDRRYQGQGYDAIGRAEAVLDRAVVTAMWSPVGG